jgi:hypothetical protein
MALVSGAGLAGYGVRTQGHMPAVIHRARCADEWVISILQRAWGRAGSVSNMRWACAPSAWELRPGGAGRPIVPIEGREHRYFTP